MINLHELESHIPLMSRIQAHFKTRPISRATSSLTQVKHESSSTVKYSARLIALMERVGQLSGVRF